MQLKRAFIVEEHALVRAGLCSIVSQIPGWRVAGDAEDGVRAAPQLEAEVPDLLLLEIALPRLNGAELTRQVLRQNPTVRVLGYSKLRDMSPLVRIMQAGAGGVLSAHCGRDELVAAIRTVMEGGVYVSPDLSSDLLRTLARGKPERQAGLDRLTERERQVMQLLAEGLSTRDVAAELGITDKTVESHRLHILHKLELSSLVELTHVAIREGIARL